MPKSSRDGMGTTTSRLAACPHPAPDLASLRPRAVRPERPEPSPGGEGNLFDTRYRVGYFLSGVTPPGGGDTKKSGSYRKNCVVPCRTY